MAKPIRFHADTLKFIEKAGRQKRTDWLDRNQVDYDRLIRQPMLHLAQHLKNELSDSAIGYRFPQTGLARLKRTADRAKEYGTPFRDWVTYSASRPRVSRFDHNPNLFFMINPTDEDGDQILVAGGLYMPSSRQMRAIRESIACDASPFEKLFASRAFSARFSDGFSNERISSRVPRGFDPSHPRLKWIQLQAFFVWHSYSKKEFTASDFATLVAKDFAQILRLNHLLDQAIAGRKIATNEPAATVRGLSRLAEIEAPRRVMDF